MIGVAPGIAQLLMRSAPLIGGGIYSLKDIIDFDEAKKGLPSKDDVTDFDESDESDQGILEVPETEIAPPTSEEMTTTKDGVPMSEEEVAELQEKARLQEKYGKILDENVGRTKDLIEKLNIPTPNSQKLAEDVVAGYNDAVLSEEEIISELKDRYGGLKYGGSVDKPLYND